EDFEKGLRNTVQRPNGKRCPTAPDAVGFAPCPTGSAAIGSFSGRMGASALAAMPDLTTALSVAAVGSVIIEFLSLVPFVPGPVPGAGCTRLSPERSEEHTSELQSRS